jgi:tRNA A-37 threonylcarbamoyl transferase component Bud32
MNGRQFVKIKSPDMKLKKATVRVCKNSAPPNLPMQRLSDCHVQPRREVFYILARTRSDAYQWLKIPKTRGMSLCHSFYRFVYGTDSGYANTRSRANPQATAPTGKLTVLQDDRAHYIILTDKNYDNEALLRSGERVALTREQALLTSARNEDEPQGRNQYRSQRAQGQKAVRSDLMADAISRIAILSDYQDFEHIATGTHGEVFSMSKNGKPFVAKLQQLRRADDYRTFEHEVHAQRTFAARNLGVPLLHKQIVSLGRHTVGVLVMPFVETLDTYLHVKRSHAELETVVRSVIKLLRQIQRAKLTHGDLALFNAYMSKDGVKTMDFGLASTDVFAPAVDVLRAATELSAITRSDGGRTVHAYNDRYLRSQGLALFRDAFGEDFKLSGTVEDIDLAWDRAFGVYCKKAHVNCS